MCPNGPSIDRRRRAISRTVRSTVAGLRRGFGPRARRAQKTRQVRPPRRRKSAVVGRGNRPRENGVTQATGSSVSICCQTSSLSAPTEPWCGTLNTSLRVSGRNGDFTMAFQPVAGLIVFSKSPPSSTALVPASAKTTTDRAFGVSRTARLSGAAGRGKNWRNSCVAKVSD